MNLGDLTDELAESENDIDVLVQIGRKHFQRREFDLAAEFYERALELDPSEPFTNLYLGNLFYARRDYRKAIERFEVAARIIPSEACPYWCLANAYEELGESSRAEHYYQKAVDVDPESHDARRRLNESYERRYTPD